MGGKDHGGEEEGSEPNLDFRTLIQKFYGVQMSCWKSYVNGGFITAKRSSAALSTMPSM